LSATRRKRSRMSICVGGRHVVYVEGRRLSANAVRTAAQNLLAARAVREIRFSVLDGRPHFRIGFGPVLDPAISLMITVAYSWRARTAHLNLTRTVVAATRERVVGPGDKNIATRGHMNDLEPLAWTQAQVQLQHLGNTPDRSSSFFLFPSIGSRTLCLYSRMRRFATASDVMSATLWNGPPNCWGAGISGDLPDRASAH